MGSTGRAAAIVAALSLAGASVAPADTQPTSKARSKIFASQTGVLDRRSSTQYAYSTRLLPQSELSRGLNLPALAVRYHGVYRTMAEAAARRHGVPEDLFVRLVQQESAWNPQAVSHKGAIGLAQLMPGTAQMLQVNPRNPAENLDGGARYLRQQYDTFGSWRLALAAYNAGPGAVKAHDGIPPYRETRTYVRRILGGAG